MTFATKLVVGRQVVLEDVDVNDDHKELTWTAFKALHPGAQGLHITSVFFRMMTSGVAGTRIPFWVLRTEGESGTDPIAMWVFNDLSHLSTNADDHYVYASTSFGKDYEEPAALNTALAGADDTALNDAVVVPQFLPADLILGPNTEFYVEYAGGHAGGDDLIISITGILL